MTKRRIVDQKRPKSQVSAATRRAGSFMEETWLDQAPDKVWEGRKTMNIEVGSEGEVRDPAAAARFEIKFQVRGIGHMGSGYWMHVVDVDEVSPDFSPAFEVKLPR